MPSTHPQDRKTIASIAAHESWANTQDRSARTAPARQAFLDKFENENERKAYFKRLALKSAKARRLRGTAAEEVPNDAA